MWSNKKLKSSSELVDEDLVEIVNNLEKKDQQADQLKEMGSEGKNWRINWFRPEPESQWPRDQTKVFQK